MRRQFERELRRERDQGGLRNTVEPDTRSRGDPRNRSDVHDRAVAGADACGHRIPSPVEGGHHVDLKDLRHGGVFGRQRRSETGVHSRIAHEVVEDAKFTADEVEDLRAVVGVVGFARDPEGGCAELHRSRPQGFLAARGDEYAGALVHEPLGGGESDAAARSGDESRAAVEAIHSGSLRGSSANRLFGMLTLALMGTLEEPTTIVGSRRRRS